MSQHIFTLPKPLQNHIGKYLDSYSFLNCGAVCKDFQAALFTSEQFLQWVGSPVPSDDQEKLYEEFRRSNQLRNYKWSQKPVVGFFSTLSYYSGITHLLRIYEVNSLCVLRLAKSGELYRSTPPTNLTSFRHVVCRAQTLKQEIGAAEHSLAEGQEQLETDTEALFLLVALICKLVQKIVALLAWLIADRPFVEPAAAFAFRELAKGKFLSKPDQGKFLSKPDLCLGVCVGKEVYARPEVNYGDKLSGGTIFSLSKDGIESRNCFTVHPAYFPTHGGEPVEERENLLQPVTPILRASSRFLKMEQLHIENGDRQEDTGDRPVARIMTQLAAEILYREGARELTYYNYYDQAHVLVCGGFIEPNAHELYAHDKGVWKRVQEARQAGKLFPEFRDESGFNLTLCNTNAPEGSILQVPVDFGRGQTTWNEIFKQERLLPGEGPILPRFWRRDLSYYMRHDYVSSYFKSDRAGAQALDTTP